MKVFLQKVVLPPRLATQLDVNTCPPAFLRKPSGVGGRASINLPAPS